MVKDKDKIIDSKVVNLLLLFAGAITLYIQPTMADPFNAPKMYLLILATSWLIGFLAFSHNNQSTDYKKLLILSICFTAIVLITSILSDLPYISFFGDSQRQLGFFTYLGFVVFMLIAARYFNFNLLNRLIWTFGLLGFIYIVYGLLQYTGNDFVKWVNQYNPIIGTLGNPNYAAAFMAMLGVFCFSVVFYEPLNKSVRLVFLIITFGLFINIYLSSARQGLISICAGVALFINLMIYFKNKIFGFIILFINVLISSAVVLGILQYGPLTKYLYKNSVDLRGYYWRAGVNMFKNNILTGVGIDRYGANFKFYRDPGYSLKYGSEITSTNAHNVYIQQFATGGIFLGVCYILIHVFIFYTGIKGIKKSLGNRRVVLSGLFSTWIAYLIQSVVSIDNIGLTIWGWILGGLIFALAPKTITQNEPMQISSKNSFKYLRKIGLYRNLISSTALLLAFVLVISLAKTENKIVEIRNVLSTGKETTAGSFNLATNSVINDKLAQPTYKLEIADYFIRSGQRDRGLLVLNDLAQSDPINPNYLIALAITYESGREFDRAIAFRYKLMKVDPYNISNLLQLARLYKETGDSANALKFKNRILQVAPQTEQAKLVVSEIQN